MEDWGLISELHRAIAIILSLKTSSEKKTELVSKHEVVSNISPATWRLKCIIKLSHSKGKNCNSLYKLAVLDSVSQSCDVVLVRHAFSSGKPQGVGILEWGGNGEEMEMGRSVYEQPGTKVDGILSQQGGFQVGKGKRKGGQKGMRKGKSRKQGDCAIIALFILYSCTWWLPVIVWMIANLYMCV